MCSCMGMMYATILLNIVNDMSDAYCLACIYKCVCGGIGEHKSSKMAHFVFKCNKEDYLSLSVYV
jgi:hypothetical protein